MSWGPIALAAVSAFSAFSKNKDETSIAQANAQIASTNATMMNAWGLAESERIRAQGVRQRAALHTATAASGVDSGTGSILDVLSDDAIQNELDAYDAQFRAGSGARAQQNESNMYRWRAGRLNSSAPFSILGAGLGGFAQGKAAQNYFS